MGYRLRKLGLVATLAGVLGLGSSTASAVPLAGDQTIVLLTSLPLLTGAGLTPSGLGTAIVGGDLVGRAEAAFPITGGDLTGIAGTIEHDGSGLRLDDGATQVDLENFLIDTTLFQLFGDASVDGTPVGNVPLFDLGLCTSLAGTAAQCIDSDGSVLLDGFKLSLTEAASGALSSVFGLPDLTGAQIGVARIDARVVPEPSTALLIGAGLVAASAKRSRRKQA
jgi:hypothetical protein